MPHTTHAYPFEAKVLQFASGLSTRLTAGSSPRSFLLVLDLTGNVESVSFERVTPDLNERERELSAAGVPHLFYDPLEDGMEYVWVSWEGVERPVMEWLIGQRFEVGDFVPLADFASRAGQLPGEREFPVSWGVMF